MKVLEISLNRHQGRKKYMRPNDMTILRNNDTATQRQRYNDTATQQDKRYSATATQRHSDTVILQYSDA